MKKAFLVMLTICFLLCSCDNNVYYWEFKKPVSEVQQISIIKIDDFSVSDINLSPIKVIEKTQYENFYNEIKNMEMTKLFRMEMDFPSNYCFLIDYGNDNYCILSQFGSGYIAPYKEYGLDFEYKKLDFNKEDFECLINKYLNI